MINVKVIDGRSGRSAQITSRGEITTAPLSFSKAYNAIAGTASSPANILAPMTNKVFVITAILLYGNKKVGAADATVTIYEANSPTTTTIEETIFQTEIPKGQRRDITGIYLGVTEGRWVNIITDDDDIYVTIMGYYADA